MSSCALESSSSFLLSQSVGIFTHWYTQVFRPQQRRRQVSARLFVWELFINFYCYRLPFSYSHLPSPPQKCLAKNKIFVLLKMYKGSRMKMQENRITSVTASSSSETSPTGNEKGSDITSNTNTSTLNANDIDQAQFEADKRAVYKWVD